MTATAEKFGLRLRALRTEQGLSLSEFARRLYYSKGHVSRVETGAQPPSVEFARRCDVELATDGELEALVAPARTGTAPTCDQDQEGDEVWVMMMAPDGTSALSGLGRRELLFGSAAVLAGGSLAAAGGRPGGRSGGHMAGPPTDDQLHRHRQLLDAARGLGQVAPPPTVLPMVVGQAHALRALAKQTQGADAAAVATLFSRTAEYAGWMAQEGGDTETAERWTAWAVRIAADAGDPHVATYALVRRALITMYQGDAAATIDFARRAQASASTPPRIMGLAAQREAQGHALAGDHTACLNALDRAAHYLDDARGQEEDGPRIGTSHVDNPVGVVTGWCLYDLGRPKEAAAILDREVARIPATAMRARMRFGVRQAMAHAASGNLEQACELTRSFIGQARTVGSATITAELRKLAGVLHRWHTHDEVRNLAPLFAAALYRGAAC